MIRAGPGTLTNKRPDPPDPLRFIQRGLAKGGDAPGDVLHHLSRRRLLIDSGWATIARDELTRMRGKACERIRISN